LRIAFITISLYGGGAEKSNLTIIQMLVHLGYHVDVYSINKFKNDKKLQQELNINFLDTNNFWWNRFNKFLELYKSLRDKDYDLLIDGRTRPKISKEFIFQKLTYPRIKKVFLVHSSKTQFYLFKNSFLSTFFYNKNHLVVVSEGIKKKIIENHNFNKVNYIPNALSLSYSKRKNLSLNFPFVLFFGRLQDEVKNISFLIHAYQNSKLMDMGIKFIILGSGEDESKLISLVKHKNLQDYIIFKPFIDSPKPYINNARATLMASKYEGFPMSIIESLAMGTPVITTNFETGPSEIIITGKNGILLNDNTVNTFSEALNKICSNDEFYDICVAGCQTSAEKFNFESVSKQWKIFLKKITQ